MLADQAPFTPHMRGQDISYVLDLSEGYAAYETQRRAAGSGLLKDLDKRRRKVEREAGAAVFTAHSRSRTDFDRLFAWKRGQLQATGQTDIFDAGWTMKLMRELFTQRDPDFGGVLFTLYIGETLAAVHFHLRGRHTIHAWIIAHDHAFDRYSPGLLLFQDIARWMDQTPFRVLDLGYRRLRVQAAPGQPPPPGRPRLRRASVAAFAVAPGPVWGAQRGRAPALGRISSSPWQGDAPIGPVARIAVTTRRR